MKFMPHGNGILADSLKKVIEIEPTIEALRIEAAKIIAQWGAYCTAEMIIVKPEGFDERTGWNTHIVSVQGGGVVGYIDQPLNH